MISYMLYSIYSEFVLYNITAARDSVPTWVPACRHPQLGRRLCKGKTDQELRGGLPRLDYMGGQEHLNEGPENLLGADPVQLTPKGYEKLAEKLADRVAATQPKKRERSDSEPSNPRQKARMVTNRRLVGISSSDTVAKRWEKTGEQGGREGHRMPPRSGNRDGPGTSRH